MVRFTLDHHQDRVGEQDGQSRPLHGDVRPDHHGNDAGVADALIDQEAERGGDEAVVQRRRIDHVDDAAGEHGNQQGPTRIRRCSA